jgi:MFS family permease
MNKLNFDATSISSATGLAGLITLPLPLVSGWLSDRFDRKRLLAICYLSPLLGTLMLSGAGLLWQFWLTQILFAANAASASVGPALITDITSREGLGSALARYNSGAWIGGIIGYFCAGVVIQNWGTQTTFAAAVILPIMAIFIILFWVMPQYRLKPQPAESAVE